MQKVKVLFTIILLFSLIGTAQASGTDADIQKAIDDCTTGKVILPADTYTLHNPVYLKSDCILTAEEGTKVILAANAGWEKNIGLFMAADGASGHDIEVYGFEVDGNEPNNPEQCGAWFYTIFLFDGCQDIVIHDMYLHDNCNDGIRIFNSESKDCNLEVYDCTFERCYHNGVYLHKANGAKIYNNKFVPRTNAGICATDSNHLDIHDNTINTGTPPTGGAGMEIQKTTGLNMDDIEIYNNFISNTNLPGIWLYGYNAYPADSAKDVYIHDNTITGCGMGRGTDRYYGGGLVVQGFNNTILEDNVLTGNYNEGITLGNVFSKPTSRNYVTVLKGNTVSDTRSGNYRSGNNIQVDWGYTSVSDGVIPDNRDDDSDNEEDDKLDIIKPTDATDDTTEDTTIDNENDDNEPEEYKYNSGSIFDIFGWGSGIKVDGDYYIVLPEGMEENSGEIKGTIEYFKMGDNITTFVKIPKKYLNGVSEIRYEVNGKIATHTLMVCEREYDSIVFTETSIWDGELPHDIDCLKLSGVVQKKDINVTCVTPTGELTPELKTVNTEFKTLKFHPAAIVILLSLLVAYIFFKISLKHML